MDTASLFFGDNLNLDEQLEWLESVPSSDSVGESNNYVYNCPSSMNQFVASSPEMSSGNEVGSQSPEEEEDMDDDDIVDTQNKRKRRQEIKNQSETKRRMKLNEQLTALRSLLLCDADPAESQPPKKKKSKKSKVTREVILSSAIQEISKLRQELHQMNQLLSKPTTETDTPFQRLITGKFPAYFSHQALLDPHNRASFSIQDLERAFQTVFARELESFFSINQRRTEQTVLHTIRMLEDMGSQIGKPEYQLNVGILEQLYFSVLKFNGRELRRVLEQNWVSYQTVRKADKDNLLLFIDGEIGAWILHDMSLLEYLVGNFEASDRYFLFAKELTKKFSHKGTANMLLASTAWSLKTSSVPTASKINQLVVDDKFWAPFGAVTLGHALISEGKSQEGVQAVEIAISQIMNNLGNCADLCLSTPLLEAYIQTRNLDKGLRAANHILKKMSDLNLDACMGKAEAMRQKANMLILKQYPDFIPEGRLERMSENSVEDLIALSEQTSQLKIDQSEKHGPSPPVVNSLSFLPSNSESANEDIEMILRSAINLAHTRGMLLVEMNCELDLLKYFHYRGDRQQALETVQMVKETCARMKGPSNYREFQKAQQLISIVEEVQ